MADYRRETLGRARKSGAESKASQVLGTALLDAATRARDRRMVARWRDFALASALLAALFFSPLGSTVSASGLLIADGGNGGRLEIIEQNVQVTINNGIAVTTVDQVFLNKENRIVEALYTFPVPNGASISNFSMEIAGKEMIGEVVEKKRAREIYDSYKRVRRDPGLLEQVDYKTFELRVFPIAAGAEQPISITYYQRLDFDHNQATYVYPLATNTAGIVDDRTHGKFGFTIDAKSEIPIVDLQSPSHAADFVITNPAENYARASLEVAEGDLSKDVVLTFDLERPRTGIDIVTSNRSGEDGYFMLSMTAGRELEESAPGMDYLFVVDISGSMANDGKLAMSREAVVSFVGALAREDRFDILTFNSTPTLMHGGLSNVSDEIKIESREFLLDQRARGGTDLRPAVTTAYKYKDPDRPLNVVILSDGMTEVQSQSELLGAIREAPSGTRVFCIGVGNDINWPLLKQVAEGAGGLAAFISHQDDFARQAEAFRRKLMRPVASNVRIEIRGVGAGEFASEKLPDLYYGSPVWLLGRYRKPGTAQVVVSAEVLGQPFEQTLEFDFPETDDRNPEIERMWAYDKVQMLMNRRRAGVASTGATEEIVALCENYSIVSEFASFIVLENDAEYQRWSIERRNAKRILRDRAAQEGRRQRLEELRNASLARLGPKENASETQQKSSEPVADSDLAKSQQGMPMPSSSVPMDSSPPPRSRQGDMNLPSMPGGGGAIDPVTGLLALGAAGVSALAARRKQQRSNRS
ncbi:MAG: VIT domain-containing protein [Planctomycetota bacterium]